MRTRDVSLPAWETDSDRTPLLYGGTPPSPAVLNPIHFPVILRPLPQAPSPEAPSINRVRLHFRLLVQGHDWRSTQEEIKRHSHGPTWRATPRSALERKKNTKKNCKTRRKSISAAWAEREASNRGGNEARRLAPQVSYRTENRRQATSFRATQPSLPSKPPRLGVGPEGS